MKRSLKKLIDAQVGELVQSLELPDTGVTFDALVRAAESKYGKPIHIAPIADLPSRDVPGTVTGLFIDTGDAGHIGVHPDDSQAFQEFSVLHELIHAIAGHSGCHVPPDLVEQGYRGVAAEVQAARARVPGRIQGTEPYELELEELVAEEGARALVRILVMQSHAPADQAFG